MFAHSACPDRESTLGRLDLDAPFVTHAGLPLLFTATIAVSNDLTGSAYRNQFPNWGYLPMLDPLQSRLIEPTALDSIAGILPQSGATVAFGTGESRFSLRHPRCPKTMYARAVLVRGPQVPRSPMLRASGRTSEGSMDEWIWRRVWPYQPRSRYLAMLRQGTLVAEFSGRPKRAATVRCTVPSAGRRDRHSGRLRKETCCGRDRRRVPVRPRPPRTGPNSNHTCPLAYRSLR